MHPLFLLTGIALAGVAAIEIAVVSSVADGPVRGAYIGVVAEQSEWRTPVCETVLSDTNAFTCDVPPGAYRVVAVAPGFATERTSVSHVGAGESRRVQVTLNRLRAVSGAVTDVDGTPITGAQVGLLGEFIEDHALQLSPLGEATRASDARTVTNSDGRFSVALPPANSLLLIQAQGFAPTLVRDVRPWIRSELGPIVLKRGASLRAHLRGGANSDTRLMLLPRKVALPDHLTSARAAALWTRNAQDNAVSWSALPEGEYDIALRPSRRVTTEMPIRLARVKLAAGDAKTEEITIPSAPVEKATGPRARILLSDMTLEQARDVVVTRWRDSAATVPATPLAVAGGTAVDIDSPCSAGTTFVITTANAIGVATASDCEASRRVVMRPRARLIATFAGNAFPPFGAARATCGAEKIYVEVPFAIGDRGAADIDVPAGCSAMTLAAAELAPFSITETLVAGESRSLGTIRLKRGGSLVARLLRADDETPVARASVMVLRASDVAAARGDLASKLAPLAEAVTNESGWLRFVGLPDEDVMLGIRIPSGRFVELSPQVTISAGQEALLDWNVPPVGRVEIALDLPERLRDRLRIHAFEWKRLDLPHWPRSAVVSIDAKGAGGMDVPAGLWSVIALIRLDDGVLVPTGDEQVVVLPGRNLPLALKIRDAVYEGRVTRNDVPVRGMLYLFPEIKGGRSATTRLDEEGRFAVLIDKLGTYDVAVQEKTGSIRLPRYVTLEKPQLPLHIRLPAGRIEGRVIDERGTPVAGVSVEAVRQGAPGRTEAGAGTQEDGSFRFESLEAGSWLITASEDAEAGTPVQVSLSENLPVTGIVVQLRRTVEIAVRVIDHAGLAIRDAFVFLEVGLPAATRPFAVSGSCNADGLARLKVPQAALGLEANVFVAALEGTLASATVRVEPAAVHSVRLPALTGELHLVRKHGSWREVSGPRLVAPDGSWIPVPTGHRQAETNTVRMRRVPAGPWKYIEASGPADSLMMASGRSALVTPTAQFVVEPRRVNEVLIDSEN